MKALIVAAMLAFTAASTCGAAAQDTVIVRTHKHGNWHQRDGNHGDRHRSRVMAGGIDHIARIDRRHRNHHDRDDRNWRRHRHDGDKRLARRGVDEIVWVNRHHRHRDHRDWRGRTWRHRQDWDRRAALDGLDRVIWTNRHRHHKDRDWRHRHDGHKRVAMTIDEILRVDLNRRDDWVLSQRHRHRHDCGARWIVDWRHHRTNDGKVIVCD